MAAFAVLEGTSKAIKVEVIQQERSILAPKRFTETVRSIESLPAKPPRDPERYLHEWQEVLKGSLPELSTRALKNIAWVSHVVLDRKFHEYLEQRKPELNVRTLKGLASRYHASWSASEEMNELAWSIICRLSEFSIPHPLLDRWKSEPKEVFGPQAPQRFAAKILLHGPQKAGTLWQIDELSPFFTEAVVQAAVLARKSISIEKTRDMYFDQILPWKHWVQSDSKFKKEISSAILDPAIESTGNRDRLHDFIIRDPRLGDPRLHERNWLGVSEEAKARVLQLLSQADIVFFFDHVLPDGNDPHDRKKFWLRYLRSIKLSRPLLSPVDRVRLQRTGGKVGDHCGVIRATNSNSAFLLMFDGFLAVEFTRVGCVYLYAQGGGLRRVLPKTSSFWSQEPFDEGVLKNQIDNNGSYAHDKHGHWMSKVEKQLHEWGVNPDTRFR